MSKIIWTLIKGVREIMYNYKIGFLLHNWWGIMGILHTNFVDLIAKSWDISKIRVQGYALSPRQPLIDIRSLKINVYKIRCTVCAFYLISLSIPTQVKVELRLSWALTIITALQQHSTFNFLLVKLFIGWGIIWFS